MAAHLSDSSCPAPFCASRTVPLLCAHVMQHYQQQHHRRCRGESGHGGARARHYDRLLRDPTRLLARKQHHGAQPGHGQERRRAWSDRAEQVAAVCGGTHIAEVRRYHAKCSLMCQRPLTLLTTSHTPLLAVCSSTASVPREQPLSRGASRATQRCKCSSKPPPTRTSLSVRLSVSAR